jgi:hypothetical protein
MPASEGAENRWRYRASAPNNRAVMISGILGAGYVRLLA